MLRSQERRTTRDLSQKSNTWKVLLVRTSGRCQYIQMLYPNVSSGYCSFFHFVYTSSLYIQMNHLNVTMFVCFLFLKLHLLSGGLINKMIKNIFLKFLIFGEKITFLRFWRKIMFSVFAEKCVLTKNAFFRFQRKNTFFFAVLAENLHFLRFWREIFFDGKCVLTKRCVFENLMGKYNPSGCNIIMYKTKIDLHLHPNGSSG